MIVRPPPTDAVRRGAIVLGVLLCLPSLARAQVQRTSPALQLSYLEQTDDGYRYLYQVNGYASGGQRMADVYLELWTPKAGARPAVTGHRGPFLFDAIREQRRRLPYAHPPVFVAVPENWVAAIYVQGVLNWGARRTPGGKNYGVPTGETLRGFELKSPALPAFRRFRTVPYRPPRGADRGFVEPSVDEVVQDSTWVLHNGIVPAPGWESDQVTPSYLRTQVDRACEAALIDNCGRYLRHVDRIQAADRQGDDGAFRSAVRAMQSMVVSDDVSHEHARLVVGATLEALLARPPSARSS